MKWSTLKPALLVRAFRRFKLTQLLNTANTIMSYDLTEIKTHMLFSHMPGIYNSSFFFRSKMLLVLFLLQRILAENVNDKYDLDFIFEVLTQ